MLQTIAQQRMDLVWSPWGAGQRYISIPQPVLNFVDSHTKSSGRVYTTLESGPTDLIRVFHTLSKPLLFKR